MITHSSKTDSDKTQDTSGKIDKAKAIKPNPLRGDIVNSDLLLAPQKILQLQKNIGNQAVMQLLRSQLQQQSVGQPGQRMESEEDEIQMLSDDAIQMVGELEDEEEPLQMKKENKTGLPDNLKVRVESLSGLPMDDVRVHYNSHKPAQVGALAYTQGIDIHVAPGQEQHLPHEAWHVIQQAQGRVQPTLQMQGVNINSDVGLEQEADEMGKKALSTDYSSLRAHSKSVSQITGLPTIQQVSQLKRIVPKAINGLTHLVKLTPDGHIYNENYLENEVCEVHFGDLLMVDLDEALYSRRGINQEVNAASDRDKEPSHLWLQAVEFNQEPLTDTYVREEMLKEPVKIDIPRPREGIDGAIDQVIDLIDKLSFGKKEDPELVATKSIMLSDVKNRLVSKSADSVVTLKNVRDNIDLALGRAAKAEVEELNREMLLSALKNVKSEFDIYSQPKQQMVVGGLIGKTELEYMGLVGLDLGGIGLNKNYLDVNVADTTNDPNHLVIGDAMDLQASFEPGCVNNVIAQLLPLVLMAGGEDTQLNRINAIKRVLEGVNYVTGGGGTVSIEFNDNSGEAAVTETILREIAIAYKFTLEGIRPSLPKTLLSSIRREKGQKSFTISSVSPSQSSNCRKFRFCRG